MKNDKQHKERVKVTFAQAMNLLIPYIWKRVKEQAKSMALITMYLLIFQIAVLRVPVAHASVIATGLVLVIMGLTFFMEGLFLGIMPLGEVIGIKLPQKSNLWVILIFSFILGFGATFAEPAIGVLRAAGSSVKAWNAPLLFLLLNKLHNYLVAAVGIGVGLAVMCGMLRFIYDWSLKPMVLIIVSILLGFSVWAAFNPNMRYLTDVAWDCGGITTGPVTVPLVLALGIGISRVVGSAGSSLAGFGVVTLASLFPILTVMILGLPFLDKVPQPMSESDFVKIENRQAALELFDNEDQFTGYVLQNGNDLSQQAVFGNDVGRMNRYLSSLLTDPEKCIRVMGTEPFALQKWAAQKGTDIQEIAVFGSKNVPKEFEDGYKKTQLNASQLTKTVLSNVKVSVQAIIPLCLFLILVLIVILRERLVRSDEIFTGIVFALIGMGLFSVGIELGLANLGKQVGSLLPSTFTAIPLQDSKKRIEKFDTSLVLTAINPDGVKEQFFYAKENGRYTPLHFDKSHYDSTSQEYVYIPLKGPITGSEGSIAGIAILLLFAFFMGYGATLAEPALIALGSTVEELTIGTFKKKLLMQSVALGVGIGLAFGIIKIVYNIPLVYLLIPPYLLALILTLLSSEEYVNIGWDSAGVTTGPITVPLVLAMGLGVGSQMNLVEGFGILAMASVWPILSVLSVGIIITMRRRAMVKEIIGKQKEDAAV